MPATCPLGQPFEENVVQRFVSPKLAELDASDAAELGQLLAATRRPANAAFLESLAAGIAAPAVPAPCPAEFACPITKTLMRDPVSVSDGHSYERAAIQALMDAAGATVSPVTGEELQPMCFPNNSLRKLIEAHVASSPPAQPAATAERAVGADEAGALALLDAASRPRVRGLVRLAAASLAAAAAREKGAAGAAAGGPPLATGAEAAMAKLSLARPAAGAPRAPPAAAGSPLAPPAESTIIMVAPPGLHVYAHALAGMLSGAAGISPVPSVLSSAGTAYPWLVHTRYYSATLWLLVLPQSADELADAAIAEKLPALAASVGALVLLFDAQHSPAQPKLAPGWAQLTDFWQGPLGEGGVGAPDVAIALGLEAEGASAHSKQAARRLEPPTPPYRAPPSAQGARLPSA